MTPSIVKTWDLVFMNFNKLNNLGQNFLCAVISVLMFKIMKYSISLRKPCQSSKDQTDFPFAISVSGCK